MGYNESFMMGDISGIVKELSRQSENILLEQLNDLVSRGLLVIHSTQPVLIRELDSHNIKIQQSVKLTLKDKEYIESLEKENQELKERIAKIEDALGYD